MVVAVTAAVVSVAQGAVILTDLTIDVCVFLVIGAVICVLVLFNDAVFADAVVAILVSVVVSAQLLFLGC